MTDGHRISPCHCLGLRQAARQVTQLYDRHIAATGLRTTQYSLLRVLMIHEPVGMQELADHMVMDRTTLSRALRPLERDGLLVVAPGRDARSRALHLTDAGRAMLERALPHWERAQAEFEARFGAETPALRTMLTDLVRQTA